MKNEMKSFFLALRNHPGIAYFVIITAIFIMVGIKESFNEFQWMILTIFPILMLCMILASAWEQRHDYDDIIIKK